MNCSFNSHRATEECINVLFSWKKLKRKRKIFKDLVLCVNVFFVECSVQYSSLFCFTSFPKSVLFVLLIYLASISACIPFRLLFLWYCLFVIFEKPLKNVFRVYKTETSHLLTIDLLFWRSQADPDWDIPSFYFGRNCTASIGIWTM